MVLRSKLKWFCFLFKDDWKRMGGQWETFSACLYSSEIDIPQPSMRCFLFYYIPSTLRPLFQAACYAARSGQIST